MTPQQLRDEIARLGRERVQLETTQIETNANLRNALTADPLVYSERAVDDCRHALSRVEWQIAHVVERTAALKEQLPCEADVAEAAITASELAQTAREAASRYRVSWPAFLSQLESAEKIARELSTARRQCQAAAARATDLARFYGLNVSISGVPTPSDVETEIAAHLAMLFQDVAHGDEPRDTVELYLAAYRGRSTT
jgi:hypothetical protein